jgi:pimeloyl-ACP methyl ester carboxylesterase
VKSKEFNLKKAYADIPEGQIFYRFEGTGEPVLLLHAGVTSSDEFKNVIPYLSRRMPMMCLSMPGR